MLYLDARMSTSRIPHFWHIRSNISGWRDYSSWSKGWQLANCPLLECGSNKLRDSKFVHENIWVAIFTAVRLLLSPWWLLYAIVVALSDCTVPSGGGSEHMEGWREDFFFLLSWSPSQKPESVWIVFWTCNESCKEMQAYGKSCLYSLSPGCLEFWEGQARVRPLWTLRAEDRPKGNAINWKWSSATANHWKSLVEGKQKHVDRRLGCPRMPQCSPSQRGNYWPYSFHIKCWNAKEFVEGF